MIPPEKTAFLFPGQGSQAVGMGAELARQYPTAKEIFEQADEILGWSLSETAWNGPAAVLDDTLTTQPALLVHSTAVLSVFQENFPDFTPKFTAGHSMGELSALVAAQALSYPAGLELVATRGQAMKLAGEISPGGMAAILGLDVSTLEAICAQASLPGEPVQVANDNCPGQVVISGATSALERALNLAKEAGAKRVLKLAVSIAAHSALMAEAQETFSQAVEQAPIISPVMPIVGNVAALPLSTPFEIRTDLKAQLTARVRWTESVQWMISQGITTFIELGSGSVLTGLLRRIDREAVGFSLNSPEDFDQFAARM